MTFFPNTKFIIFFFPYRIAQDFQTNTKYRQTSWLISHFSASIVPQTTISQTIAFVSIGCTLYYVHQYLSL